MDTKGKVHRHALEIHIRQSNENGVVEHKCIADMSEAAIRNQVPTAYEYKQGLAEHFVRCWNAFEEGGLVDKLFKACEAALEFIGRSNKTDWDYEITPVLKAAIAEARNDKAKEVSK